MWICSKLGFYSIVKKGDRLHIRARRSYDLVLLLDAAGIDLPINCYAVADYRWRLIVPIRASCAKRIWKALIESIDYENFKDTIHSKLDQVDKLPAYSAFWASMQRLQW